VHEEEVEVVEAELVEGYAEGEVFAAVSGSRSGLFILPPWCIV
jgi:hypothetical protein